MAPIDEETVPPPVHQALAQGRKLQAVLLLGQARDIDLKEAKAAVDRYLQAHPSLDNQWVSVDPRHTHWRSWGLFALMVAGLLAYLRLSGRF